VLLVTAIGLLCQSQVYGRGHMERNDLSFFEAALSYLPMVLSDFSVTSAQCLVLFSIYYCCLLNPCQAHDYALMASFKTQNLLKW